MPPSNPEDRMNIVIGSDTKEQIRLAAQSTNRSVSQLTKDLITSERSLENALQESRSLHEELARQNAEAVQLQEARIKEEGYVSRYEQNSEDFFS